MVDGGGVAGGGGVDEAAGWDRRGWIGAAIRPARGDLAPPIALWVRGPGVLDELCDQAAAIVGARAATGYGLHVAGELGAGLATAGFTVVSGAAIGVDGAAHRGALAAGGPNVAVLACGIDRSYPAAHEALLDRIAATGVVLSEYPPGSVPARHRFLVRNRLIAGLAAGTVVVEAGLRSGAQRTAADARSLGRPVMAVPGPVTSGRSAGCHRMIREGAVLVTRVEEVLEEVGRLGLHLAEPPPPPAHGPPTASARSPPSSTTRCPRGPPRALRGSPSRPGCRPTPFGRRWTSWSAGSWSSRSAAAGSDRSEADPPPGRRTTSRTRSAHAGRARRSARSAVELRLTHRWPVVPGQGCPHGRGGA